jgi:hypothetical protein
MKVLQGLIFTALVMISTGLALSQPAQIPATNAVSPSGEMVEMPEMLHGKVGVLVLGFSQGSRTSVTEWGRRLAAEYRAAPSVLYYEMPMLASVPRPIRGLVIRSMRSSVPEGAQSRFVPLTADETKWRALAHDTKADDAYVLVVDESGGVRWQTEGDATDAAFAAAKQQIQHLLMK